MPNLKTDRSYHEALRRMGVQDPGEVSLAVPVSLQTIADDVSHLVAPVQVPVCAAGSTVTAVAAQYSGVELQSIANGVVVELITLGTNNDARIAVSAASMLDVVQTNRTPQVILPPGGAAPVRTAQFFDGRGTAAITGAGSFRLYTTGEQVALGFYLPPGFFFHWLTGAVNQEFTGSIIWREIPRPQEIRA